MPWLTSHLGQDPDSEAAAAPEAPEETTTGTEVTTTEAAVTPVMDRPLFMGYTGRQFLIIGGVALLVFILMNKRK